MRPIDNPPSKIYARECAFIKMCLNDFFWQKLCTSAGCVHSIHAKILLASFAI